eukprot:PhM_4_TR6732/c0_g1_i1/m.89863
MTDQMRMHATRRRPLAGTAGGITSTRDDEFSPTAGDSASAHMHFRPTGPPPLSSIQGIAPPGEGGNSSSAAAGSRNTTGLKPGSAAAAGSSYATMSMNPMTGLGVTPPRPGSSDTSASSRPPSASTMDVGNTGDNGWKDFYAPVHDHVVDKTSQQEADVKVDLTNKNVFLSGLPPRSGMVQGYVMRNKGSMMVMPKYSYYLERSKTFMLASQAPKKGASNLISFEENDLAKDSANVMLKVRSNFLGTEFTIQDLGPGVDRNPNTPKAELGAIMFEQNRIGRNGPRRMTVLLPAVDSTGQRVHFFPSKSSESMIERFKKGDTKGMIVLQNKQPKWNDQIRAYTLEFHGRVTMASVKNFQLVEATAPNRVVIQFGRVEGEKFNLDYQYPLTGVQAFAIAVSSLDSKLACD